MANVAQMGVNEFWKSVTDLQAEAEYQQSVMDDTRQRLIAAYSDARRDPNPANAKARMAVLDPVVHQNNQIRLKYRDLVSAFNQAVTGAKNLIQKAGLRVPNQLSGLGQIETGIVIIGVAVAALGTAWLILKWIQSANKANTDAVEFAISIANDPNRTPAERQAATATVIKKAATAPPPGGGFLDFSSLALPLAILAAIMLGPQLLAMVPKRKAA